MKLFTISRSILALVLLSLAPAAWAQSRLVELAGIHGEPSERVAVSAATLYDTRLVTTTSDGADKLTLATWDLNDRGAFTRRGSFVMNGYSPPFVLLATTDPQRHASIFGLVGVAKTRAGQLQLFSWGVPEDGSIQHLGAFTDSFRGFERIAAAGTGSDRIVTAVQDATGATKLDVFDVSVTMGTFTRRGGVLTSPGTRVALTVLSSKLVVSAIRNKAGMLEVATFRLNPMGDLTPLKSLPSGRIADVDIAITATASDRAVIALRDMNDNLVVMPWDISDPNNPKPELDGAKVGVGIPDEQPSEAPSISIASIGGNKLVTAYRQKDGNLHLITWQASEAITHLTGKTFTAAGDLALTTLGWDRLVILAPDATNTVRLTSWVDNSVGLLKAVWNWPQSPSGGAKRETEAQPLDDEAVEHRAEEMRRARPLTIGPLMDYPPPYPAGPPPNGVTTFDPGWGGPDPMIAAGQSYVIVTNSGGIAFYKKVPGDAPMLLYSLTTNDFFNGFWKPTINGVRNPNNINLYLHYPSLTNNGPFPNAGNQPGKPQYLNFLNCDPTVDPPNPLPNTTYQYQSCINTFYDTRVLYDQYRGRFVIVATARADLRDVGGQISAGPNPNNVTTYTFPERSIVRRYIAIAVSRADDLTQGFHQWMIAEDRHLDWERVAVSDGSLVLAYNAGPTPIDLDTTDWNLRSTPMNAGPEQPLMAVFNSEELAAGARLVNNVKIYPYELGGGSIIPVIHHGETQGWTYMIHLPLSYFGSHGPNRPQQPNEFHVVRFARPATGWGVTNMQIESASVAVGSGTGGSAFGDNFAEGVHLQGGYLSFATADEVAERIANKQPARYVVRVQRISIMNRGNAFSVRQCPMNNVPCPTLFFSTRDADDASTNVWGYEMASLAVNDAGNMVIVHGRVPFQTGAGARGQEARYRIFYADNRLTDGAVLRIGDKVLTSKIRTNGTLDEDPTTENYKHVDYMYQNDFLDYGNIVADPVDGSFWMAHAYATSGGFYSIAGHVVP
jgi:hypothetical protein